MTEKISINGPISEKTIRLLILNIIYSLDRSYKIFSNQPSLSPLPTGERERHMAREFLSFCYEKKLTSSNRIPKQQQPNCFFMILLSFSRGDMGNNPSPVSGSHQSNLMKSAAENDCKPGAYQRFSFSFYPQVL